MNVLKAILIAGPTASGKSALALAEKRGGVSSPRDLSRAAARETFLLGASGLFVR
jgi:hypothetical protein